MHRPWSAPELREIVSSMPSIRDDPHKFHKASSIIVQCHKRAYIDMNVLLNMIILDGLLLQLKQKAQWPEPETGLQMVSEALQAVMQRMLALVLEIAPIIDWGKLQSCKQKNR